MLLTSLSKLRLLASPTKSHSLINNVTTSSVLLLMARFIIILKKKRKEAKQKHLVSQVESIIFLEQRYEKHWGIAVERNGNFKWE